VTWARGKEAVRRLLDDRELDRVPLSSEHAERLLAESEAHLASAAEIVSRDPVGGYQLAYDAARKACVALLAVQGLRATSKGGHIAVQETMREQFGGIAGSRAFDAFGRMRRRRADTEYPDLDTPTMTAADAQEGIGQAREIVGAAETLLIELGPFS
jgi:hypothetical protein